MIRLRALTVADLPHLRRLWKENWGGDFILAHGITYRPDDLHGFVVFDNDDWIGVVTYVFSEKDCEIVSIDSLRQGQGIGTTLITAVVKEAREANCKRIFLITTNDNLNALRFYQKRGFELVAIHRGAVNEFRKIKPGIPLIGENDIPLRDEIELELPLTPLPVGEG